MTNDTHTPAPWVYEASTRTIRARPSNYWLASMDSWDGAVNHEANARLIAAAPELLAAAKACMSPMLAIAPHGVTCEARDMLAAAIAKAEGGAA
jgi:hypothetical protein